MMPQVTITFRPTEAAKVVFDYEIVDPATATCLATARSVQVFTTRNGELLLYQPDFYKRWLEGHDVST